MVIVTYDEFGGQWDHVPPPGQGGTAGPHDQFGPGDAHPGARRSRRTSDGRSSVDHTQYDTTSILATIETRWRLAAAQLARRGGERPLDVFGERRQQTNWRPLSARRL